MGQMGIEMLRVTLEIVPFGDETHPGRREIGHLNISLRYVNRTTNVGQYVSYMTTDGKYEPPNPVVQIFDHKRAQGAFMLVERALKAHLDSEYPGEPLYDSEGILGALRAQYEHVCGLQGYDPMQDPMCSACDIETCNLGGPVCPSCGNNKCADILGIEYTYDHPQYYDGVSEWQCKTCGVRWGRWSGEILEDGQCERRYGY